MTIKDRVKSLCKDKGITADNLEKELGFAKGYISHLDASSPNINKAAQISEYFGVSLDYLFWGENPKITSLNIEPPTQELATEHIVLIETYDMLNKEQRIKIYTEMLKMIQNSK